MTTPYHAAIAGPPAVTVVIPVYNEESRLARCIERLVPFLAANCRWSWEVVIADNGSTDRTLEIARRLSERHPAVRVLHRDEKGRGGALRQAWSESRAAVLSYMDADLSSDLAAFPLLIERLLDGTFDLATGSRLLAPSSTRRSLKREAISRAYNFLVRSLFHTCFSDAQCGFKAITRKAARELLPLVENNGWFLDTELLVMAETLGYRILDLPVRWLEDAESRVKVWRTVREDLAGMCRLRQSLRRLERRNPISLPTPACLRA
ncbi:MAG: dolichyl-phosphate beta-glucosyltransferase [Limisphaerales bacterium]